MTTTHYARRDHLALGQHFMNHMSALTGENLRGKFEIAAELAWRDKEIESLRAQLAQAHQRQIRDAQLQPVLDVHLPRRSLSFALDYDGTITGDYLALLRAAQQLRAAGHQVRVVTMRYESECTSDPLFMEFVKQTDGYVATARRPKRQVCQEQGVVIDIWIDDNPQAVDKSAMEIWGSSSPEGEVIVQVNGRPTPTSSHFFGVDAR